MISLYYREEFVMKEELLSEENYQKANQKIKVIGVIIMILGLLLIAGGTYFVITSSHMETPEMTSSNWFNAVTSKNHMKTDGIFMIIPGVFLTALGAMVRFIMGNQRKILAYQMQRMIPVVTETAEKLAPTVKKLSDEMKDDKW